MGLERLIKEGWFDKSLEEFNLPLTDIQISEIKEGKEVVVNKGNTSFIVYIRKDSDIKNLTESDIIIRELPNAARPAEL